MMDLKTLKRAIEQISEEKGIDPARILDAIESSIAAAYKKEYEKKGEIIKAKFDLRTGDLKFWQAKTVVDETTVRVVHEDDEEETTYGENDEMLLPRYNSDRHIFLAEALAIKPSAKLGDELEFPLETHDDFGRIAAQTAKQVILQKLREAERESVLTEFKNREGEIVSGLVQRFERGSIYIDLGRAMGIMFGSDAVPGEHYKPGDRLKFYIMAIQEDARGVPGIVLSRSHPKFVMKLFSLEVPEVGDGTVEIKAIAREPGSRTKIAVASKTEGVDPVGACVGQRGTRVMAVSNELGQEKIDIIEWSEDPAKFIGNSLSPARAQNVEILPRREARVFVDDQQLSLAIGKGGQNVRLAAKLTGWKIDVRSATHPDAPQAEGIAGNAGDAASSPDDASSDDE
jgi:N utilization substance protein A